MSSCVETTPVFQGHNEITSESVKNYCILNIPEKYRALFVIALAYVKKNLNSQSAVVLQNSI